MRRGAGAGCGVDPCRLRAAGQEDRMLLCEARLVGQAGLHRSGVTERAAGTVRWLRGGCSRWWAPSTPLKVVRRDNTITEQTQTVF